MVHYRPQTFITKQTLVVPAVEADLEHLLQYASTKHGTLGEHK